MYMINISPQAQFIFIGYIKYPSLFDAVSVA
jgi:hypothetical protein